MNADEARDFLTFYLEGLVNKDWAYIIPQQEKASKLVVRLYPTARMPRLQGTHFPMQNVALQKQSVETALVNLEDDPSLLEDREPEPLAPSPWAQTADQLNELADSMPETAWTAQAIEAQQLVMHVNSGTASQIEKLVNQYNFFGPQEMPNTRSEVIAAIKGAARAARIHGAIPRPETGPGTVVNVSQEVSQSMTSVTITSIAELLAWDDLPQEVCSALQTMKAASEQGDKPRLMKAASEFADQASKFPHLVSKIGDVWDWISSLL